MKYADIVIVKRWITILQEYEQTKAKVTPRPFRLCGIMWGHLLNSYQPS